MDITKSTVRLVRFCRFRPDQFDQLLRQLDPTVLRNGYSISRRQRLLIFLHMVAHGRSYAGLMEEFHHSHEGISSSIHQALKAVVLMHRGLVKQAQPEDAKQLWKKEKPLKYLPWFEDCVGALDGSHLDAYIVGEHAPWRNHKGLLTQNVLAVVDHELPFTYVLPGWEGSTHDGRVLGSACADHSFGAPASKYYLADAGYTNTPITMVPYRGVRYHLREVRDAQIKPRNAKELFNLRHSSLRNVIERAFGILKRRFQVFDTAPEYSYKVQNLLVYACTALHNFLINTTASDAVEEPELEENPDNCFLGTVYGNAMDNAARKRNPMAALRDELADAMWEAYDNLLAQRSGW